MTSRYGGGEGEGEGGIDYHIDQYMVVLMIDELS